ncbi:DUF1392 family protein [Nostoc punctiforme UO1]|uniref:DUF1392 family protein n=1 Tax=Nostoc punctiforme TaxID=272131 RepID=UPI0030A3D661
MIDYINAFKTCWYLSPPWRGTIPPVEVNLLERVYLRTTRTFGYCCGMQWKHECWVYPSFVRVGESNRPNGYRTLISTFCL